ncbi:DUF3037 domain-containing protein [Methylobacterium sp. E-041]|uniref:DUF3037 domain-containing protein n=1 Tax=Methylobacterium sp. E-041 TaxID=2836573 RepID=UPI001FB95541|nr:DUF3037 domain-containing protein [Methylobacterium sp. E-041]MCJ2107007.1 DUF3037 domain-containing protein [Methylobacterium sp. E-041]
MTERTPYSYTVLRYIHDVMTGEFINVGVVLYVPAQQRLLHKIRATLGRTKNVFPDLDAHAFKAVMASAHRCVARVTSDFQRGDLFEGERTALSLAYKAVPLDNSSLQWSPLCVGTTDDPAKALDRIYTRQVARYDGRPHPRRTDEEVWRPVRDLIAERKIPVTLEEKVVSGATDTIKFQHAWKNGSWHAYTPLSLDLADAEGIKDKARKWRGHLSAVADGATVDIKLHFVVGAPQNDELKPAYRAAVDILRKAPFSPQIFEDGQIDQLVSQIEDEVRSHGQRQISD